jgi:hypothetical protein
MFRVRTAEHAGTFWQSAFAGTGNLRRCSCFIWRKEFQMLGTILIVVLLLMLLGAWPSWPHSRGWGYYPSSTLGLVLVIVVVLALLGRI